MPRRVADAATLDLLSLSKKTTTAPPLRPAALARRSVAAAAASPASSSSPSSSSRPLPSSSENPREKTKKKKKPPPTPTPTPTLEAVATPMPSKLPNPLLLSSPQEEEKPREYDWRSQWYPVCYLEDLRESPGPIRVSLFDEPVAVALKTDEKKKKKGESGDDKAPAATNIIALADRCSHRGAALSEGRVTAGGCLQCPYHAWTFDAGGACVAIPHAPGSARRDATEASEAAARAAAGGSCSSSSSSSPSSSSPPAAAAAARRRTSVRAYAATVSQGLVWLSPSPPESAPPLSGLSTLPELDAPGWVSSDFVRDFDGIDFPLLVQNVADPDHGLFAHQTPSFDAFSAAVGMPMRVSTRRKEKRGGEGEGEGDNEAAVVVGRVEAAPVLTKGAGAASSSSSASVAELVFEPPCHVRWARMDAVEGGGGEEAKFIAAVSFFFAFSFFFVENRLFLLPSLPHLLFLVSPSLFLSFSFTSSG